MRALIDRIATPFVTLCLIRLTFKQKMLFVVLWLIAGNGIVKFSVTQAIDIDYSLY